MHVSIQYIYWMLTCMDSYKKLRYLVITSQIKIADFLNNIKPTITNVPNIIRGVGGPPPNFFDRSVSA